MATCKSCGKSGLFLKVTSNGFCVECQKRIGLGNIKNFIPPVEKSPLVDNGAKLSIAELELLTKFMRVTTINYLSTIQFGRQWEEVSKKSISKTIEKFIDEKLIVPPDLSQQLDYVFKVSELKEYCIERGIKTSGKKEELITRLLENDETGMRLKTKDKKIVICSEEGLKLAQDYLDFRQNESDLAKEAIIKALKTRDFKLASRVLINYEVNQFFQRGISVDWKKEKAENYIPTLSLIFTKTPTVLREIREEHLELLRVGTGFNYLWGKGDWSFLENTENVSAKYDNITCARLIESYCHNLKELDEYREIASELRDNKFKVEINTMNDEFVCPECEKLAKKKYALSGEIPELPHIDCKNGCRCSYSLDIGL
ncbi:MAG: SAP domain-containing protein [Bellilinea sp.]